MHFTDFNDIIFEGRNKEYGAYFLRRNYNKVVIYSLIIAIIIGVAMVLIPYFKLPKKKSERLFKSVFITMENLKLPGSTENISLTHPPPISKGSSGLKVYDLKYVAPMVVDTIPLTENPVFPKSDSTGSNKDGVVQGENDDLGFGTGAYSAGVEAGAGGGGENGIYNEVAEMPRFKGGDINKFREWVQKKTKYPETATVNGVQGKVYIIFVIEMDGSVSNVKVARGVDPLIDDEALKSVKSSPKWTPGKHKGKAVRVSYFIAVNFEL